ncbi:hypothetical protein Mapa_002985 [Marchantia paleacea]|nr:hypothetical protein Mapa_002985 [Marchantia paleacea]
MMPFSIYRNDTQRLYCQATKHIASTRERRYTTNMQDVTFNQPSSILVVSTRRNSRIGPARTTFFRNYSSLDVAQAQLLPLYYPSALSREYICLRSTPLGFWAGKFEPTLKAF